MASWNFGTSIGRRLELVDILKKKRTNIACLQVTQWKGEKTTDLGDGFKALFIQENVSPKIGGIVVD